MDNMRWRYGDTNPVICPVDADTIIEIGDLVYMEDDDCRPVNHSSDGVNFDLNKNPRLVLLREFHNKFLGVAMQRSRRGDTDSVRVATTGVFEFDCVCGEYHLGTLVAPAYIKASPQNQMVQAVPQYNCAIGRVAKQISAGCRVLVAIESVIMTGGPQQPEY